MRKKLNANNGANASKFKTFGRSPDGEMVKARLTLRHYNLADGNAALAETDAEIIEKMRSQFALLGGPAALERSAATVSS